MPRRESLYLIRLRKMAEKRKRRKRRLTVVSTAGQWQWDEFSRLFRR